jgi:hypothetical protein
LGEDKPSIIGAARSTSLKRYRQPDNVLHKSFSHNNAQKAQNDFLKSFVLFVPFRGYSWTAG